MNNFGVTVHNLYITKSAEPSGTV